MVSARSMIEISTVQSQVIRHHYDFATLFYRLVWGPHIHHGYWEGSESASTAQIQLTERLAQLAKVERGCRVYDVGCGIGGSSHWLARHRACHVTGITLSPLQKRWASCSAALQRIHPRPKFLCGDAEKVELPPESCDLVWSIECTEHFFEKPEFFVRASRWLRPQGRFALCAWLAGRSPLNSLQMAQAQDVCRGMFCPSLGSQRDYVSWMEGAGLIVREMGIWTRQVERTWEICLSRVRRLGIAHLAKLLGGNHALFLNHFESILSAYRSGAMEYGYFIAEKAS